ncbi:hypothetical protein PanWU01x14_231240 [Parasponia andersonii]|uniref:Putative plant transposon protein domain-containing protein n=1 Tax=Parasponia andersonii TaxID=3476 RepID=A0A2P5BKD1_PARAD|nr:hypothetical protein PanWU01x14_231240 [Parasponia andersonii]
MAEFYANAHHHTNLRAFVRGTRWKQSQIDVITFPAIGLCRNANAIYYFFSAKLLSSSNISGVTKERAALNYAILKGLIVDVGKVIQSSILHIAGGSTIAGLGHLSLIYELCR